MSTRRVIALVLAIILLIPALAMFVGGAAGTIAFATARNDDGFFDAGLDGLQTRTAAVVSDDIDLGSDPGPPDWVIDAGDVAVQFRAEGVRSDVPLFIGIGPEEQVDAYLDGVAVEEVRSVDGRRLELRPVPGDGVVAGPPADQAFWEVSAVGTGEQVLEWDLDSGRWVVVVMNGDGSPGVAADLTVGVKAGFLLPLFITLLILGAILTMAAVAILVAVVHRPAEPGAHAATTADPAVAPSTEPVALNARLDEPLSPWKWLVKWILAIPHFIVLAVLWVGFTISTIIAFFAILFTGRYPASIFDFNLGVLRWTWRVMYYATTGGIGTDRYPPFSLGAEPDYPATLDIARPQRLSQGLVLVKWWLLAIPHYLILGLIVGGGIGWWGPDEAGSVAWGGGLIGLLVLFAGISLLFRNRYPQGLFDLIVGVNRWMFRVIAYAALMTDRYPPFRLDQGGSEPPATPPPAGPDGGVDLRREVELPDVPTGASSA
ncbi:MAG: DUF4389 domain-containing protein [Acidimicrobiales bacterium]